MQGTCLELISLSSDAAGVGICGRDHECLFEGRCLEYCSLECCCRGRGKVKVMEELFKVSFPRAGERTGSCVCVVN